MSETEMSDLAEDVDSMLQDINVGAEDPRDDNNTFSFIVNCLNIEELNDCYGNRNIIVIKQFKDYLRNLVYTDQNKKIVLVFMLHEVSCIVGYAEADLDQIGSDTVEVNIYFPFL